MEFCWLDAACEGMEIDDAVVSIVCALELDPLADGTQVVAEVE
jgi:hypothetical protein